MTRKSDESTSHVEPTTARRQARRSSGRVLGWVAPVVVGVAATTGIRALISDNPAPAPRSTVAPWGLPDQSRRRIAAAHLPSYHEQGTEHFHLHLDVVVDGVAVAIPAGVGLTPPYSAVHTHSTSGMIHAETNKRSAVITVGQFFTVWGVRLSPTCIGGHCSPEGPRLFLNGVERPGDPGTLRLASGDEITVVMGPLPARIPVSYDCAGAADLEIDSCRRTFLGATP